MSLLRRSVSGFVTDDRGAVDLPSTMVTVVILAALFGAIALTVFQIVPWVQDTVAKSDLTAVCSAQDRYATMNSGVPNIPRYTTLTGLIDAGLLPSAALGARLTVTPGGLGTPADHSDDTFVVEKVSAAGTVFEGSHVNCTPVEKGAVAPPVALPHEAFLDGAVFKAQPGVNLAVTRTQTGNTVTYVAKLTTASVTNISTRTTVDWTAWAAKNQDPTPKDMTFKNWKVYGAGSVAAPTVASQVYTTTTSDVSWQWAFANVNSTTPVTFTYQVEGLPTP